MRVIQCLCGARVSGADEEHIVAAMKAHSDEAHAQMQFTEEQVRAALRSLDGRPQWDGQTRTLEAEPEIVPLTPERAQDFFRFFDGEAFMENPAWASCYCLFYESGATQAEWQARTGEQNKAEKAANIAEGRSQGYLAMVEGRPVAWCNAAPRRLLPRLDDGEQAPEDAGAIICFLVAPPYRRQGLATKLLDAACEGLRAQGLTWAEAYPAPETGGSDARSYHGPRGMYEAAGFEVVRETPHGTLMRKRLV